MATDAPNSAGAVSIEVKPDGKTFEPQLKTLVVSAATRVAADLAKALSAQIPKQISDAIRQGIRDGGDLGKAEAAKTGQSAGAAFADAFRRTVSDKTSDAPVGPGVAPSTRQGSASGGAFADGFKKRVEAALKTLPDAKLGADASDVDRAVEEIRAELASLASQKVGVDISDEAALAHLGELKAQIDQLGAESASVKVRVDLAAAAAQLAAFQVAVAKVATEHPTVNVDVDAGAATAELVAVQAETDAVGAAGISAGGGMGALGTAILTLGPIAIPVLAAVAAGVAAIGPLAFAGGAALGVTALGFHGIAAAVEAMGKQDDAASKTASTLASKQYSEAAAADQVRSATASLVNTKANAASQEIQSAEQVANAERQLTQAQQAQKQSEDALTQSHVAAKQALEDLNNQVIDNTNAQRQGALDVVTAQQALDAANTAANAAPTNQALQQARVQAQLNFDEAVQHNKELATQQQRLTDQQTAANRAGIDGSSQVVAAQQAVVQANQQVLSAQQAVADARRTQADQARQSAFAIQQAEQGVVSAQRAVAQAASGSATATAAATSASDEALSKLGPAGQKFAKFIFGLEGDVKSVQNTAEAGLLPGAQQAIENLLPYLPQVDGFVGKLSRTVGDLFVSGSKTFTDPFWRNFFGLMANEAIPALQGGAKAASNLATGAAGLVRAFLPLDHEIGSGLVGFTNRLALAGQNLDSNQGFQKFLAYAETEGPKVVHAVEDVGGAVIHVGEALAPIGDLGVRIISGLSHAIDDIPVPVLTVVAGAIIAVNLGLKAYSVAVGAAEAIDKAWNIAQSAGGKILDLLPGRATAAAVATEGLATAEDEAATGAGDAKAASSGFSSFLAGPWGVAIGAATVLVGLFIHQHEEQKQKVDSLVTSLGELDTAYKQIGSDGGDALRTLVAQDSQLQKLILDAAKFGVSTDIAGAINGSAADQQKVLDSYDQEILKLKELYSLRTNAPAQTTPQDFAAANLPVPKDFDTSGFGSEDNDIKNHIDALTADRAAIKKTIEQQAEQKAAQDAVNASIAKNLGLSASATPAQVALAQAIADLGDKSTSTADSVNELRSAQQALVKPTQDAYNAAEDFESAYDAVTASVTENGKALNITSAAGRANTDSVKALITAAQDAYYANLANGVSLEDATGKYNDQITAIEAHTKKLGLNKDAVQSLVDTFGKLPADPKIDISVDGAAQALTKLQNLAIAQLALSTGFDIATATKEYIKQRKKATDYAGAGGLATGGPVSGLIRGPGTKTSDSVPLWGSAGEFMQPAHAVDYYGVSGMEAIRTHAIPKELIQGLAAGGEVWPFVVDASKTEIPTKAQVAAAFARTASAKGGGYDGPIPAKVAGIQKWIRAQAGKPYIWDEAGPGGYDCSGLLSAVFNLMVGQNPYEHTFSTSSEGKYFPLPGWGVLTAGWAGPGQRGASDGVGHTAGNLAGLAFESRGSRGVVVGPNATPVTAFAHLGHYGSSGVGGHTDTPGLALGGLVRPYAYDSGGYLPPGLTLAYNGTQKPEPVFTDAQHRQNIAGTGAPKATLNIEQWIAGSASAQELSGELAWTLNSTGM